MGSVLALLAAVAFALGTTLQQRGTLQTDAPEGDPRFLTEVLRKPVWLAGGALQAAGWVLQAVALDRTSLIVVQALCALSLVLALPFGAWLTDQVVTRRSITGAVLASVGIVAFVAVGQPTGGTSEPGAAAWWSASAVTVVVMVVLALVAGRRRGGVSAALFASAAGLAFAYQAAVTKVFVSQLGGGLVAVLTMWTTWALVVSALAGFALQQSALKTGFLAPAMAASNAVTLFVSVVLGVTVFDESLTTAGGGRAPGLVGLVLAVVGVALLAAAPPGADADLLPGRATG
jgi:drug/metabolite transporter (DMT)-like permease